MTRETYYEVSFALSEETERELAEEDARAQELFGDEETLESSEEETEESSGEKTEESAEAETEEETEESAEEETEEEYEVFALPDPMMLPEGTLITAIAAPERTGYVFLGWYYDAQLNERVGSRDKADRNMTLYPRFGLATDPYAEFMINYVSAREVEPDYEILVAAFDLEEEEIRQNLIVRDINEIEDEEISYELVKQAPDLARLIPDRTVRTLVQDTLLRYEDGELEEQSLAEAL